MGASILHQGRGTGRVQPRCDEPTASHFRSSRWRTRLAAIAAAAVLVACGGGTSSDSPAYSASQDKPATREEAARFLTQATFGVTEAEIDRVMRLGYGAWIDDQFNTKAHPQVPLLGYWDAANARIKAADATKKAGVRELIEAFYQRAVNGDTQLRDRVAFALSQIMVVSTIDGSLGDNTRLVASYYDTLADKGLTTYRSLLESVALHPAMGIYLSHLRNEKENGKGRVPDQNFAREVMQLFSIGLYRLNIDGSLALDAAQKPVETYTADDIKGLSYVFTGFSWAGPDQTDARFYGYDKNYIDPNRDALPMQAYPRFHSTLPKQFLGVSIPASTTAGNDLKTALDTLGSYPNNTYQTVAPFICKQLIQRLVTSNPRSDYVMRVALVFGASKGDMKSVIKAILTDPEARDPVNLSEATFGKVREPVLRLTALMRAFGAKADDNRYTVDTTDDPGTSLGQTPLRSPSVFNFYRPGYVPPNTRIANTHTLVAPEMQLINETTIAGYANYVMNALQYGIGASQTSNPQAVNRADIQFAFTDKASAAEFAASELHALAEQPTDLLTLINRRLLAGQMSSTLHDDVLATVGKIAIPALKADNSNLSAVETARRRRIMTAIYLTAVSPEFLVQK